MPRVWAFLLLLPLLFIDSSHAQACTATVLWSLCQQDPICAYLFRHDGPAGITDALEFFNERAAAGRPIPSVPLAWQTPAFLNTFADCSDAAAQSTESVGMPPAVSQQLNLLVRWRGYMASSSGIAHTDPNAQYTYDSQTDQYYAGCAAGHVCAQDATAPAPLSSPQILAIVAASAMSALAVALFIYSIVHMTRTRNLLPTAPRMPLPSLPSSSPTTSAYKQEEDDMLIELKPFGRYSLVKSEHFI